MDRKVGRVLSRLTLLQRAVPLLTLVVIAVATLVLPGPHPGLVSLSLAISLVALVAALVVPWERQPVWLEAAPVLAMLPAVGLLQVSTAHNVYAPLALAPIFWLALLGTRRQAAVAVVVGVAMFAGLAARQGLTLELLRPLIWGMAATFAMLVTHHLRSEREHAQALSSALLGELATTGIVSICDADGTLLQFDRARGELEPRPDAPATAEWGRAFNLRTADGTRSLAADEVPLWRALHGERVERVRIRADRPGRPESHVVCHGAPISSVEGESLGAVVVTVDVTDQALAEEQLRERERMLGEAQGLAQMGSWEWDLGAPAWVWSEQLSRIFGRPVDAPPPSHEEFLDYAHPEDFMIVAEGIEQILNSSNHSYSYRIVLPSGEERHLEAMHFSRFAADGSPTRVIGTLQDITERRMLEQRLRFLADHDALTGLLNRRRFSEILSEHLETMRRYGPRGAVMLLDLDRFKAVNDTLGHDAGDELIELVGQLLGERLRHYDVVARLGGDEFVVLLPEADVDEAAGAAGAVGDAIAGAVADLDTPACDVRASIGVALIDPRDLEDTSGKHVLARADAAMYAAKRAGRACYRLDRGDEPVADAA